MIGKNRHFHWKQILPRHFISTAKIVNYPYERVKNIILELTEKAEKIITEVQAEIPLGFPSKVSEIIFEGFRTQVEKLKLYTHL
ncbi:hypothetical protein [Candidatus Regiella insecticola]|nr:hypothetical protein [Candidatus Regiella insecticola]